MRTQRGGLRKRKSGGQWQWLATWRENGQRRAKTLGACTAMTKTEAQAALAQIVQPINEKRGATIYSLQGYVRDVVWPWLRRNRKISTTLTDEYAFDHYVLKYLGIYPLSWFTRVNLQEHLDRLTAQGLGTSVVAHQRWALRQAFAMAVNDGLLPRNPAELLHTPKPQAKNKRVLTLDELRTIFDVLPLRDRIIIQLAGLCGMRPGEILALQFRDLTPDGIAVRRAIYRNHVQTPKSHLSVRTVAITDSMHAYLRTWRDLCPKHGPEDWVFANEKHTGPISHANYWRRYLKPVLDKLHITGVTFQALRRTAITLLNELSHLDPSLAQAQFGHSALVSFSVYNRPGVHRQTAAIMLLDQALNQQQKGKTSC